MKKKLLLLLIILVCASCGDSYQSLDFNFYQIVTRIQQFKDMRGTIYCEYYTSKEAMFRDSCGRFNIGDTVYIQKL